MSGVSVEGNFDINRERKEREKEKEREGGERERDDVFRNRRPKSSRDQLVKWVWKKRELLW